MTIDDRRLIAGLTAALCGVVLIAEFVLFMNYGTAHIRWSHAGVLAAAAAAFALGALAYLHGTRAAGAMTPQEITTAYYLKTAAWLPPVVFAGRQP